jgi:hypothetical protein
MGGAARASGSLTSSVNRTAESTRAAKEAQLDTMSLFDDVDESPTMQGSGLTPQAEAPLLNSAHRLESATEAETKIASAGSRNQDSGPLSRLTVEPFGTGAASDLKEVMRYIPLVSNNLGALAQQGDAMTLPTSRDSTPPFSNVPQLPVVEAELRGGEIWITSALTPLRKYRNAYLLYLVLLSLADESSQEKAESDLPYVQIKVGYSEVIKSIKKWCQARLDRRSVQRAAERLIELGYVERTLTASEGFVPATYSILKAPAVMKMFAASGCTHYRILRGKELQLIRPRSPIKSQEVLD